MRFIYSSAIDLSVESRTTGDVATWTDLSSWYINGSAAYAFPQGMHIQRIVYHCTHTNKALVLRGYAMVIF